MKSTLQKEKWSILIQLTTYTFGLILLNLIPQIYIISEDSLFRNCLIILLLSSAVMSFLLGAFDIFSHFHSDKKQFFCRKLPHCIVAFILIGAISFLFFFLTFSIRQAFVFGAKDKNLIVKIIPCVLQHICYPLIAILFLHILTSPKQSFREHIQHLFSYLKHTAVWLFLVALIFYGLELLISSFLHGVVQIGALTVHTALLWTAMGQIFIYIKENRMEGEKKDVSDNQ